MSKRGFSLIELMIVVVVFAIVAGMVVINMKGIGRTAEEKLILSELSTIRKAVLRFKQDMGQSPQFIVELLQPPDDPTGAGMGGWWWRSDGNYPVSNSEMPLLPDVSLFSHDPATRRGWNGPYLQSEIFSGNGNELEETRVNPDSALDNYGTIKSDAELSPPKKIAILKSDYSSFPQAAITEPEKTISHYQLIFNDSSGEIVVWFLDDPTITSPRTIAELRLGIKL